MDSLFEVCDSINTPMECFVFESKNETFPVLPHWHYFAEAVYMLEGTAEITDNSKTYILKNGDFIFFHPKSIHSISSADGNDVKYGVIKFDINLLNHDIENMPKIKRVLKSAFNNKMPVYFNKAVADKTHIEELFMDCIHEMKEKQYGYEIMVNMNIFRMVMEIIRYWRENGFCVQSNFAEESCSYNMENITEYIDEHLSEVIQVTELAEKCGMSYSCFARKFHNTYSVSCKEYIDKKRVAKVENFLIFTDFDLNYISQESGFSDCSHMIRNFKKYHNMTPKQFRTERAKL